MTRPIPAGVPSQGTRRVVFIEGPVADIDAITVAEVTAGVDLSCYLLRQNGLTESLTQNKINDGRYCSAQDFQQFGTKSKEMSLGYTFNLKEPTDDVARLALPEGTRGTLVTIFQVDEDSETYAADDWYKATPVQAGEQHIPSVEDNAMDRIEQQLAVTGSWTGLKQLVAA